MNTGRSSCLASLTSSGAGCSDAGTAGTIFAISASTPRMTSRATRRTHGGPSRADGTLASTGADLPPARARTSPRATHAPTSRGIPRGPSSAGKRGPQGAATVFERAAADAPRRTTGSAAPPARAVRTRRTATTARPPRTQSRLWAATRGTAPPEHTTPARRTAGTPGRAQTTPSTRARARSAPHPHSGGGEASTARSARCLRPPLASLEVPPR